MNTSIPVEIELPICHVESERPATEMIEAVPVGPRQYRLLYSPGMVEGLARGDVIELSDEDPRGFKIISRSGELCVWFYFETAGPNRGPEGDQVRAAVERAGGACDGGGNLHLVFSIPIAMGFPAVEALMNELTAQYPGSSWLYGNVYDPWNDFKPFGWWEQR
jgi:hypothetical protein